MRLAAEGGDRRSLEGHRPRPSPSPTLNRTPSGGSCPRVLHSRRGKTKESVGGGLHSGKSRLDAPFRSTSIASPASAADPFITCASEECVRVENGSNDDHEFQIPRAHVLVAPLLECEAVSLTGAIVPRRTALLSLIARRESSFDDVKK